MSAKVTSGRYRGRFAPSPTGPLHFGSLLAAVASFLQARVRNGIWRVRIEDLDPPREAPGAAVNILRTLEAFGLHWDGEVRHQGRRNPAYAAAVEKLATTGRLFPCACSRREIADRGIGGVDGPVYPGTCRNGLPPERSARALRVRTDAAVVSFSDGIQGPMSLDLERTVGDFIVYRADGLYAYQLAVVVDDAADGVTEVVRGADLLLSTPRQIHLQHLLDLPTPAYRHIPVAVDAAGCKLSKSAGAAALDRRRPGEALWRALSFLGQRPAPELYAAPPAELWPWALAHWRIEEVPSRRTRPAGVAGWGDLTRRLR